MKIVIANIVSVIEMIFGFRRHSEINRNKVIFYDYIVNALSVIAYALMNAFSGIYINVWCIIKLMYMQIFHKEKKITLSPMELFLLNIPIMVLGIMGFMKEGIFAFIYAGVQYLKGWEYWFKTDRGRVKMNVITESGYAIYNAINFNYVKTFKNVVNIVINCVNVYRIRMNGEDKFYN